MRPYHLSAFAILLAWQVAPLPHPVQDDSGRTRWEFSGMASAGQWEDATYGCNGQLLSAQARRYRDIGARIDVLNGGSGLRVSAAGGITRQPDSYRAGAPDLQTTSYGIQVASEGHSAGIGAGVSRRLLTGQAAANLYLRLGPPNLHLRMEVRPLTETPMLAGDARIGLGFRAGSIGLVVSPYYQTSDQAAGYVDLGIPVTRNVDLRIAGVAGPGAQVTQWGFAAGLRVLR